MYELHDFLEGISVDSLSDDYGYTEGQYARHLAVNEAVIPDLEAIDLVIMGVEENRGGDIRNARSQGPDAIRRQFYRLYNWHPDVRIADIGNVRTGKTVSDSYAAVKTVLAELLRKKKKVILLGGSHDNTLAQYYAYKELNQVIEASCIDCSIDISSESRIRTENFLMEMLTGEPNLVRHYNHIGFQSYFVHPRMLETMDKLRFDCHRVGTAKEDMEEMEPVLRNTDLLSIDINAIKYSDSPASRESANGFSGEEACMLTRYAGLSSRISSMGIYGYSPELDVSNLTAKQIAQMIWYFIDGHSRSRQEAALEEMNNFNEYHSAFSEVDTIFLQSKKTGRWWMQLPDKKFIACSHKDYLTANQNQIPERWLRAQERN